MKIFLLFYMCHFAMGLTLCYETTVFLHLISVLLGKNTHSRFALFLEHTSDTFVPVFAANMKLFHFTIRI